MSENSNDQWMEEALRSSHRRGYHRPGDNWECGVSTKDCRCTTGPTNEGECPSQSCRPVHRLHWWRRRSRSVITVLGICIGSLLVASPWHREFLAPGELSKAHSQILHGPLQENRCAACHPAGELSSLAWLAIPHPSVGTKTDQKTLCIQCHQHEMADLALASPHDLTRQQILALRDPVPSQKGQVQWVRYSQGIDWESHDLACSDCHREHQGPGFDLKSITSQRCQACHAKQFQDFASTHPEFEGYPYARERRLSFDHASHRDKHFSKDGQTFDCRKCHVDTNSVSAVGQVFRTTQYETACASCHDKAMKSSLADGILVFQMPSLDKRRMASQGLPIVNWPEESGQLMDGRLPPIMAMLLLGDAQGREVIQALPASGLLSDLNLDSSEDMKTAFALAEASQRLLQELAEKGQEALQKRIASAYVSVTGPSNALPMDPQLQTDTGHKLVSQPLKNTELSSALRARLSEGMPPDLFRSAYRDWFQSAHAEDTRSTSIQQPSRHVVRTVALSPPSDDDLIGDDLTSDDLTKGNLPNGNSLGSDSGDQDLLGAGHEPANRPSTESKIPDVNWSRNPLKPSKHLAAGGWYIDPSRMAIVYLPTGHADPWLTAWNQLAAGMSNRNGEQAPPVPTTSTMVDTLPWNESKIAGHLGDHALETFMREMLDPKTHGFCMECHSSQQLNRADLVSSTSVAWSEYWKAKERPPKLRQLTHFDHTPHLILPSLQDCTSCHPMSIPATDVRATVDSMLAKGSKEVDSSVHQGEFLPMTKANCASCHRENAAGESCTQCHSYHIGREGWEWDHAWKSSRIAEAYKSFQRVGVKGSSSIK